MSDPHRALNRRSKRDNKAARKRLHTRIAHLRKQIKTCKAATQQGRYDVQALTPMIRELQELKARL